jgi:hypothetical protein
MELKLNEVEVQKLNLQPGEVLVVKVRSDIYDERSIRELGDGLRNIFKNNKVVVLAFDIEGSIDLTTVQGSEYPEDKCGDSCCGGCGEKQLEKGE